MLLLETIRIGAPAWIANAGAAVFWYVAIARLRILSPWPLDGGTRFGGRRVFGDSRTVFGSAFMLLTAASVGWLQGDLAFGLLLGCFALAGTLASSFLKRRMGLREGAGSVLDHVDYGIAVVVGLALTRTMPEGFDPLLFVAWVFAFQAGVNALARSCDIRSADLHAASGRTR